MDKRLCIEGYTLNRVKLAEFTYRINVFRNDKSEFSFIVTLQPTGNDTDNPKFQPESKNSDLPKYIKDNMELISDWLKEYPN